MISAKQKEKAREIWVMFYKKCNSVSLAFERFGISRPTLYRWINRYKLEGKPGLSDKSKRPKILGNQKVTKNIELLILELRSNKWGPLRISNHLNRKHSLKISSPTVWRILTRNNAKPIKRNRRKSDYKRYSRPVPGDRVQMDVMKIRPGWYQYTAIDDCTRLKVIRLYNRKRAVESIDFLGEMLDDFPFPIQIIQTDWGTEFFAEDFQYELHEHFIKFRPTSRPRSPHLNGKVERTQQTDKVEFWRTLDLSNKNLPLRKMAKAWQDFYNKKRPHSSLGGRTPWQKYLSKKSKIPIQPDVTQRFWDSNEKIKVRNYQYQKLAEKLGL